LQFDFSKALVCLLNVEICKLKAIEREYETENERQEQKSLITEFTPFTGLRLRVPLQWVPIQLMVLKWYKDVPGISEHQLRQQNRLLCKALKTPLSWQLQFILQKEKKAKS
jgi:hypothetical protein